MRRNRSKEINIFSMSALDLFASALGAFILIAVIALPYYLNNARIDKHFFVITMAWDSKKKQDIDLIIKDPQSRVYTYKKVSYVGSSGALTVDSKHVKHGTEIWIDKKIDPKKITHQKWEVYYKRYSRNSEIVDVNGAVLSSVGTFEFPKQHISGNNQSIIHIATIQIANDRLNVKTY